MAANHPTRKCGALPIKAEHLARLPKFRDYQKAPLPLDTTPATYDGLAGSKINMGGNDQYGDCTCAAIANLFAVWCHALGIDITIVAAAIVSFYMKLTGGQDTGLDPTVVLDKVAKDGIDVGDGVNRKLVVYVTLPLDDLPTLRFLMWKLKALYLAGDLSDNDVSASSWSLPATPGAGDKPDPDNGHAFLGGAFGTLSADGDDCPITYGTWGEGMPGTYSWLKSRGVFVAVGIDAEAAEALNFDFEAAVQDINNAPTA